MTTDHSSLTPHTSLLLIVGPTGIGKTAVAVELCNLLNGEIVSADSMQIYRGCDIGTAKPSPLEMARALHHLIDIREPTEKYSAVEWARDATTAIADIVARGRQPLIVGGTGFYIRALLQPDEIADVPPNPALRDHLEREAALHGAQWLHNQLAAMDAAAAQRLHVNDVRRVIRAIEIAKGQKPDATNGALISRLPVDYHTATFGLDMPRARLYERLGKRIDDMLEAGFLQELRDLVHKGVTLEAPVMQGLGYRQMLPALDDTAALAECVALWKRDTRRYAKRQLTWFRHQLPVQWITLEDDQAPLQAARHILQQWQKQHTAL